MKKNSTLIRYFLSYFIILCLLLTGFLVIIQVQMTDSYNKQQNEAVENRLDILEEQFISNLTSVLQTHLQIRKDMSLFNYRHNPNYSNRVRLNELFSNFDSNNDFIDSIIYINPQNGTLLATNHLVQYKNNECYIYSSNNKYISFALDSSYIQEESALLLLSNHTVNYLLYFPNDVKSDYLLFYMIDLAELQKMFRDNLIGGIDSYALYVSETSQIYGIHTDKIRIEDLSSAFSEENNVYICNDKHTLHIRRNIFSDFSLIALISNQYFTRQMYDAFRTAYILLFIIGVGGFLLIFFCMKMTYFPLAKFTQKIVPQIKSEKSFIEQLDHAFTTALTEKQQLQEKINKYHLSIQTSLLESCIDDQSSFGISNIQNIDQIFRTDCDNCIYMIRIHFEKKSFPDIQIQEFLENMLPKGSAVFILEAGQEHSVYVINYIGSETDKDEVFFSLISDLHSKFYCFCAISNSVSSLTDIPSLYENTLFASNFWSEMPVVSYSYIKQKHPEINDSIYPYKLLDCLSESLKKPDFEKATELLKLLLEQIDFLQAPNSNYPDFIIRCLLIDILMTLFSFMNQHNIKFKLYNELYFETLYYCRSCTWQEKKHEITDNLHNLLQLFQNEQQMIRTNQILEYLETNYSSSELTITSLADYFNVSIAYMSYLFKKEFGENFVDYLWKLRFQKASDMLLHTDMPIDTISVLVGYINPSSFRRKFKQETGMTPSQYRSQA